MSSGGDIRLENVTLFLSTKKLKCEVTGEAPAFLNDVEMTDITVIGEVLYY